jgi:hypothetical protein
VFVGPTRLYLNDVEELVGVLSKVLRDVRIKADGYEVTDPADLPKLGRQIKDFTLSGFDPYVVVSLKPNQVSVYCEDGHDALGAGLLAQVEDVLRRRRAAFGWLRPVHLMLLSLILLGASLLIPSGFPKVLVVVVGLPLACFLIVLNLWTARRDTSSRGRVYTSRSGDRVGWIQRNGDAALIALVAAVIGSAVGGVLVALVTGAWKP